MTGKTRGPLDHQAPDGPPALPRWVKLLGFGAVIVAIVLAVALLLVGGEHGPGMHGG